MKNKRKKNCADFYNFHNCEFSENEKMNKSRNGNIFYVVRELNITQHTII